MLFDVAKRVSQKANATRFHIIADMIWCSIKYGTIWSEYGDLDFIKRNKSNRESYITTFYNFKLYKKYNNASKRYLFRNKIQFLNTFTDFVEREWVSIEDSSINQIALFLDNNPVFVAKSSIGDSGNQVSIVSTNDFKDYNALLLFLKQNNYDLLEEKIENHRLIKHLNPTSLNTLRIVTVNSNNTVHVLFAGIRVGAKDALLDNISQGGMSARINISTGVIETPFYFKQSANSKGIASTSLYVGYPIPYWDDVINIVNSAALVVPEVRIVAWDIAITDNNIELIEGNESFGSVIMQMYNSSDEEGLKPRLIDLLDGQE